MHLDLDAFFCCVEELRDPSLRGKAFAVGGSPERRGVVSSCSYPARARGVHSAMPMAQAVRLVPGLIVVSVHFGDYHEYSRRVMAIVQELTPVVEQISVDEAFLDVTGIREAPDQIARSLQSRIRLECGLPCSVGVASNKLVAKIANNQGKRIQRNGHTPAAIEVVPNGGEAAYLASLPISELWGIGDKTAERLRALDITRIGDLVAAGKPALVYHFGRHGADMWERAQGLDTRPVEGERETKSVSAETTFDADVTDRATLEKTLHDLSQKVARRLRGEELQGLTIRIKLRWDDFTTVTRQIAIPEPTCNERLIVSHARALLAQAWDGVRPVRLIGVGVSNFRASAAQLSLFDPPGRSATPQVERLVDTIQERFGDSALRRARDLKPPSP